MNCLVYIDDVLIYSKSFEEHLKAIEEVFSRLIQHNFKLKPSKCDVLKPELLFLGHLISAQGLKPNPKKVDAVERCPTPTMLGAILIATIPECLLLALTLVAVCSSRQNDGAVDTVAKSARQQHYVK